MRGENGDFFFSFDFASLSAPGFLIGVSGLFRMVATDEDEDEDEDVGSNRGKSVYVGGSSLDGVTFFVLLRFGV